MPTPRALGAGPSLPRPRFWWLLATPVCLQLAAASLQSLPLWSHDLLSVSHGLPLRVPVIGLRVPLLWCDALNITNCICKDSISQQGPLLKSWVGTTEPRTWYRAQRGRHSERVGLTVTLTPCSHESSQVALVQQRHPPSRPEVRGRTHQPEPGRGRQVCWPHFPAGQTWGILSCLTKSLRRQMDTKGRGHSGHCPARIRDPVNHSC